MRWPPDGDLVVAVSGGADSAFLAWALAQRTRVRLIHVDHGTEAAPSLKGAAEHLAADLGLPLEVIEVVVPDGPSWEAQARHVRRTALREAAGDAAIATGHHRDDQAETVLGNLIRGAGATGLAGMAVPHDGWCRPLLDMTHVDIRKAVAELGLPFVDDPSNFDTTHRRNKLRHDVVPTLDAVLPGIVDRLVGTAALLAADDAYLDDLASRLTVRKRAGAVVLSRAELCSVPVAVASRAVRGALRSIDGTYAGSAADVTAVMSVAVGEQVRATVSNDVVAHTEQGEVVIGHHTDPAPWDPVTLAVPGRVEVLGRWVTAAFESGLPVGRRRVRLAVSDGAEVMVRPAIEGDRIDIRGGHKLASDAFREAHVPVTARSMWPVVALDGRIAWLVGVRAAAWAVAGPEDRAVTFETGAI